MSELVVDQQVSTLDQKVSQPTRVRKKPTKAKRKKPTKVKMTPLRRKFGVRLKAMREKRQLSQTELGKRTGMSGKYLSKVEQGQASLNLDSLYKVSKALKINLHWLVTV